MTTRAENRFSAQESTTPELLAVYLARIGKDQLLTHQEEVVLFRHAKSGDKKARQTLIEKNLRLVVWVARRYRGCRLPLEDLIQEGNIGLMKAVEKFDPDRGYRFTTYAIWWIRRSMQRAVADKGRIIRLSVHMAEKIKKVSRAYSELSAELGREPTKEEVAEGLGWTVEAVRLTMEAIPDATSLDLPVDSEEGASVLGTLVEDERCSDMPDAVGRKMEIMQLREAIDELPERARYVLVHRYGLGGVERATLRELGNELNITREGVRKIQYRAEQALRSGSNGRALHGVVANDPTSVR